MSSNGSRTDNSSSSCSVSGSGSDSGGFQGYSVFPREESEGNPNLRPEQHFGRVTVKPYKQSTRMVNSGVV